MSERTCAVCGSEASKLRRGLCGRHYQRLQKYGSVDLPERAALQCSGPECDRPAGTSGLCLSHYKQQHLGKDLTPLRVATKDLGRPSVCEFPDCGRPHKARGMCKAHNDQAKLGKPLRPVQEYGLGLTCIERECGRTSIAKGRCSRHRQVLYDIAIKYNLTPAEYDALIEKQGGVCAICGGTNANGYRLSVDHDHDCCPGSRSCGRCVRALLCAGCNFVLGHARDNAGLLRSAAAYIELHTRSSAEAA